MLEVPQPESENSTPIFAEASGAKFEKLILDLIREEYPGAKPQINGKTKQNGFDIQVTLHDGTRVFIECKHRQNKYKFKGSELAKAVDRFIKGEMSNWADKFCLITSGEWDQTVTDAKERAITLFQKRSITFEYDSREDLWYRLRKFPHVVKAHLGPYWGDVSRAWLDALEDKDREHKRQAQQPTSFLTEQCDYYDDGFLKVNFDLPTRHFPRIHLSLKFKTDGLNDATILLDNDEVLRVFDEASWREQIPFFLGRNADRIVLQTGNALVSVSHSVVQVLIERIRAVREKWIERIQRLDSDWEAEGFRFLGRDKDRVKLGRIRASIWRAMINFANNHDSEEGKSKWHIFDSGTNLLKVYTEHGNEYMDRGHHLILFTQPEVTFSTGDSQFVVSYMACALRVL